MISPHSFLFPTTDESLSCYRDALLIRMANNTDPSDLDGSADVCESLECIANVYRARGEADRALQFFGQCLRRRRKVVSDPASSRSHVTALLQTYEDGEFFFVISIYDPFCFHASRR